MVVHLLSPNDRYDMTYLRNYAVINVKDRLSRLPGIGSVQLFGSGDYSMRVWLDPRKVAARNLAADDIVKAIREQNVDVAAGVIGSSPAAPGVDYQISVNARGRLTNEQDFENIVIATTPEGVVTRLKDVARIELGASEYALRSLLDNKSAVAIPIFQAPGSNALQISDAVRATIRNFGAAPLIPPLRILGALSGSRGQVDGRLEVEHAFAHNRTAPNETGTAGYTIVNASLDWHPFAAKPELTFSLQANNLFDVDARRSTSVLKDFAPLGGRDIRLSARMSF